MSNMIKITIIIGSNHYGDKIQSLRACGVALLFLTTAAVKAEHLDCLDHLKQFLVNDAPFETSSGHIARGLFMESPQR